MVRLSWIACLLMVLGVSSNASAGWPFFAEDGVRRGSAEWYELHAESPPGARQKYRYGKMWPVQARPCGPSQTCVQKYHTAHYWPHPYNIQDRSSVRSVYQMQVANGWQTATTFYSYHFDETTNELNSAGMQHLAWLVTHVPAQHRQAYLAITANAEAHTAHLMSLEESLAKTTGEQGAIPVIPRAAATLGRPASEVQGILNGAAEGALPPVISYRGAGTSEGG
jgi:hypothetical protein